MSLQLDIDESELYDDDFLLSPVSKLSTTYDDDFLSPSALDDDDFLSPKSSKRKQDKFFPETPKTPKYNLVELGEKDYIIPSSTQPERIQSFIEMIDFLSHIDEEEKCKLINNSNNNRESFSTKGEARDADTFRLKKENVAVKVMKDNDRNRNEINWYHDFTQYVLDGGFPHFPLMATFQQCESCNTTKNTEIAKCLAIFSELGDGDLKNVDPSIDKKIVLSMVAQVLMACIVLEKYKVVHNDMHIGNVLYQHNEEQQYRNKYLHYIVNDRHIYVKHLGFLCILWDFGMMVKEGDKHPLEQWVSKHSFDHDFLFKLFPDMIKKFNLSSSLNDYANQYRQLTAEEFLYNLPEVFNDIVLISDNEMELPLVNNTPYLL